MMKTPPKLLRNLLRPPKTVSVIRLAGVIGGGGRFSKGLEDAALSALVTRAFKPRKLAAVALSINSPGGSPAQSGMIARRIARAAKERGVPVYAFCEDVAASGGYMLACAADRIYVDEYSIIGSIGVISASFGFEGALQRIGVERRVHTAGDRKLMLDPFSRENPEDVERLRALQRQIHARFIDFVTAARGERLRTDGHDLFNGDIWVGAGAVEVGLVDAVGHLDPVMKAEFGENVRIRRVQPRLGMAARLGLGKFTAPNVFGALESRAMWERYGL